MLAPVLFHLMAQGNWPDTLGYNRGHSLDRFPKQSGRPDLINHRQIA